MGGFWPGHEATGPNQSLRQQCMALSGSFDFRIIARDRAFGAVEAAAPHDRWVDLSYAQVRYLTVGRTGATGLAQLIKDTPHDIMAMNGFFDREFTIPALVARRFSAIPRKPCVLSTRGEMAPGALGLKSFQKQAYRRLSRSAGLLRDVWIHATGPGEAADARRELPFARGVLIAPIIRGLVDAPGEETPEHSDEQPLRLVFVGRITPVKNVAFGLDALRQVTKPVVYDLYGPVADPAYWQECQNIIATLPPHIVVRLNGEIKNDDIPAAIAGAGALFLPTLGENFGHAIFEALSCGVPVLISDRTPWRDLQEHEAGWSLPLDDRAAFTAAIEVLARMPASRRNAMKQSARAIAEHFVLSSDAAEQNRRIYHTIIAFGPTAGQADADALMHAGS